MLNNILYEDNHLLVLDKPAGILTQPSGTDQASLEEMGKQYLKETYQKPGNVFLEAIHRLDQAASGIVVFAKTSKALSRLMQAIREKKVKKFYRAQVERTPKEQSGRLEHYLAHRHHHAEVVDENDPGGKFASLTYEIYKPGKHPVLNIHLETGRYHQIRCQLAKIGCPILGDKKYGSTKPYAKPGIALHHYRMEIFHPISLKKLIFTLAYS